jgi:hypothetical protein
MTGQQPALLLLLLLLACTICCLLPVIKIIFITTDVTVTSCRHISI